ncbi:MAG TPA: cytochrome c-type biogenesis protein CcmH [Acidobacteriaceae bacterium]|jgi:cytochrome c-type biogenesis protein CcmH/NrfF|nr:cytochrome c-type biogenesis protein CcmH [Acidobacteriaceae bacterium]
MRTRLEKLSRLAILPLLVVLGVGALGANDTEARFDRVGHKLMCACGCNQVLLACDHIGCPNLQQETAELKAAIARGDSENAILEAFQAEYGPTVLAAPWLTKFNIVAWVVPPALLILGLGGTFLLVRKWKLRTVAMPYVAQDTQSQEIRERIRRDTEL